MARQNNLLILLILVSQIVLTVSCKPSRQRCAELYGTRPDIIRIDTIIKHMTVERTGTNSINCDSLLLLAEGQQIVKIVHDTVSERPIAQVTYQKQKGGRIQVRTKILRDTVFVPFKTVVAAPPVVCPEQVNKWKWFAYGCLSVIGIFVIAKWLWA